jgi:hypothetical protein
MAPYGLLELLPYTLSLVNKWSFGTNLPAYLSQQNPSVLKVEGNFPELRSPNTQNAVKIVTFIFPIIHDPGWPSGALVNPGILLPPTEEQAQKAAARGSLQIQLWACDKVAELPG